MPSSNLHANRPASGEIKSSFLLAMAPGLWHDSPVSESYNLEAAAATRPSLRIEGEQNRSRES